MKRERGGREKGERGWYEERRGRDKEGDVEEGHGRTMYAA